MLTVERSKRRIEAITITADFSDRMATTDSIASASVAIEVFSGDDPSPSDMLYLPIILDTQAISQRVKLGVIGAVYDVQFSVVTADGFTFDQTTRLAIIPNAKGAIPEFIPLYLTSRPYPMLVNESMQVSSLPQGGELRLVIIPYANLETVIVSADPLSGELRSLVVSYAQLLEAVQVSAAPLDGTMKAILRFYTDASSDVLVSAAPRDGTLKQILIQYTSPPENILTSATPQSGTLA